MSEFKKTLLDGYTRSTLDVDGNTRPEPLALWIAKELEAIKFTFQGSNAIMDHVSEE